MEALTFVLVLNCVLQFVDIGLRVRALIAVRREVVAARRAHLLLLQSMAMPGTSVATSLELAGAQNVRVSEGAHPNYVVVRYRGGPSEDEAMRVLDRQRSVGVRYVVERDPARWPWLVVVAGLAALVVARMLS